MQIPRFMRRVNRSFTNPLMMTFAWLVPPLAIVHHVGRKSGRRYRSPVLAFGTSDAFVIPMTYGRDVDWARNLVAAKSGDIEQMGQRHPVKHVRIVDFAVAAKHLPTAVRPLLQAADFPGYVVADLKPKTQNRKA